MKKVGIIKRIASVGLIFLLSINSFAAIVSDNDGSAFVTKAEFDALKNSFAKQIEDYNSSIDGKIDGAIAAYLAGIQISTHVSLMSYYDKYKITGFGTSYPLIWSSRTTKATTAPYNTRCGYTEKFDPYANFKVWFAVSWDYASTVRPGYGSVNLSNSTFRFNDAMRDAVDVYIKEDGVITQVCDIKPQIHQKFSEILTESLMSDTTKESNWIKYSGSTDMYYNEDYSIQIASYCGSPGSNMTILPNGNEVKEAGDPMSDGSHSPSRYGWFRTVTYVDWPKQNTTYVPVLQPFATHNVNCVVPDVSKMTGYNSSGDSIAKTITVSAVDSAKYSFNISQWWQKRTNYHVACMIDLRQLIMGGFSVPTENPSEFIFNDFKTTNALNGKIKNGLLLCDIDKDGEVEITCTPTETGEIYYWQAKTSTDNWGGKKPTSTLPTDAVLGYNKNVTKNTIEKRTIKVTKDGGPIWVLYRPLGTTNEGELKNFEIIHISED